MKIINSNKIGVPMDFIQHTIAWIKGEIFEASLFGSFGLLTIIGSLVLWRFGSTPSSKALIIPLLIVGVFFLGTAISGIVSNKKKLPQSYGGFGLLTNYVRISTFFT